MRLEQLQVQCFMEKAGQECPMKPKMPSDKVQNLRIELIDEELQELSEAFVNQNIVEVADAIGDLMVVVIGAGVACGIDLAPVWDEINRSNMSKFIDGHRREDGKWMKGPSYSPANLTPIIQEQLK